MISLQTNFSLRVMIATALVLAVPFAALAAISSEDKCEASKNKTVGAYYSCRAKAEATAITKVTTPDYTKCNAKFLDKWDTAETKFAGLCPDTITQSQDMADYIAAQATEAAAVVGGADIPDCGLPATGETTAYGAGSDGDVQAGAARSFTDNGDGTITDNATGLMWEKKSDDGSIHDWDNTYTWSTGTDDMDGTIVTTFLANLNSGGGFAGHTDWRVPNQFELFSLVNLEEVAPSTYSAFDTGCAATCTVTTCSCTQASYYWSSSTYHNIPSFAWDVFFAVGDMNFVAKTDSRRVRAVRAGS